MVDVTCFFEITHFGLKCSFKLHLFIYSSHLNLAKIEAVGGVAKAVGGGLE